MNIVAFDQVTQNEHPILGRGPIIFFGTDAPDGDASPWADVPVGSEYRRQVDGHSVVYRKNSDEGRDDDWKVIQGIISQRVVVGDFTDGAGAAGTLVLANQIPIGAFVERVLLRNVTGFTGNTSAVLIVGDGTTADRYNTGTPSVFTTANAIDMGAVSGTAIHTAAATPRLTVTSAADFTAVTAGALTIDIYYR
jgi:hypothetical protein